MGLRTGQHVGAYVIDTRIGQGGMASVWRAWDKRHGEAVAIKVMADSLYDGGQLADRFIGEIRHHHLLRHPNIVRVREVFSVAGRPCMAMDLAAGGSLASLLDENPAHRLPCAVALPLVTEVLKALDYAHQQSMVHRDVKPSNVLLDESHSHAFLSDFGIAFAVGEKRLTQAGIPVGTSAYMSPEQIHDTAGIDYRSDVYSVGCVLYETLTGRPPFVVPGPDAADESAARAAMFEKHLREKPVPPKQRASDIPAHVNTAIMLALEKDRTRRIQGCAEFAKLLNAPSDAADPSRLRGAAVRVAAAALLLMAAAIGAVVLVSG